MTNTDREKWLDIAAELIVSPIALCAKACELAKEFSESEAGKATADAIVKKGADIGSKAKDVASQESVQKVVDAVKTAGDNVSKTVRKVMGKEDDVVDVEAEEVAEEAVDEAEAKMADAEESIDDIIDSVDVSEIAPEDDCKCKGKKAKKTEEQVEEDLDKVLGEITED